MNILQILQSFLQPRHDAARLLYLDKLAETPVDKLASCIGHHDGYVREAALRCAGELKSPVLLPAIVERLNDWVPQVKAVAQAILLEMLPSIAPDQALRLLPAVQRLRQAGRADHSAWIASFERALAEKLGPQTLIDHVLDPDVHVARACWKLVEAGPLAPLEALIERLLPATPDIVLARHAVEAIFRLPEELRDPLFRRALASGFGMVRAIALRPVLAVESAENDVLAIRMASDLQTWVRLIASAYLKRRGMDLAAILAQALCAEGANSVTLRACLAGLAEQGSTDRLDLIRSFTRHPVARVQLGAYFAWLRLEPARRDEIALDVLRSRHRRVRKLAMQLVRKDGAHVDAGTALSLMALHDDLDMMFAFARRGPWDWLELIVQLDGRSRHEPVLRARLEQELRAWVLASGSMYVKPSPAQRALFQDGDTVKALAALASALPTDHRRMAQRLSFELGQL